MEHDVYEIGELDVQVLDGDRGKNYPRQNEFFQNGYCLFLSASNVTNKGFNFDSTSFITEEKDHILRGGKLQRNDVVITTRGTVGNVCYYDESIPYNNMRINSGMLIVRCGEKILSKYIYYVLKSKAFQNQIKAIQTGSAQPQLPKSHFVKMKIRVPEIEEQERIVNVLSAIDKKINSNNAINNNLLEQVLTLYRNKFVDTANNERAICRADEYFDISIGKTPPRKEPQWFSTNPQDVTWVSISDMGTCGLYISSSSEQLTKQAVERHNVKVVPDNTVLLSFKLTVGRIAITNGEMTTNEAIAHFKTNKKEINEYLYCYLKCFNYQTMGSTSSIATAVNSKIIKGMPFVVPTNDELKEFHGFAAPMFAKIKANQIETDNLTALRDTLLPKLMSGELDVSDIDL